MSPFINKLELLMKQKRMEKYYYY